MDLLGLASVALIIIIIYKVYIASKGKETIKSEIQEWHHLAPLSQRYDSRGVNTSFVYFIRESGMQRIKIGKANDPEQRKKELSTGSAHNHEIVHLIKSENPFKTESLFHKHFREKRCKGEWFNITEEELRWVQKEDYPREIEDSIKGY
ncbi:GIY-YIG nuclease family protein [Oceanobacillus kapialis]|uniref:GIY-YIG nuclease family protein n=1 Tax=Oceanobacillus kapialis TaxID=481353 RepID=A0ABW5PW61_9BACI